MEYFKFRTSLLFGCFYFLVSRIKNLLSSKLLTWILFTAYPGLRIKPVKVSPPKPGRLYPCLSDMDTESEVPESDDCHPGNDRLVDVSNICKLSRLIMDISTLFTIKYNWQLYPHIYLACIKYLYMSNFFYFFRFIT